MTYLNKDILILIFEELENDSKSLYSCLLVNRTWCELVVPILWRNPYISSNNPKIVSLFNVILLYLSEESRDALKNQGINNLITEKVYERPLFNYIYFWKYLELSFLESLISSKEFEKLKIAIIRNEILRIFINKNTKLIHLCVPYYYDYQLQQLPGAESCLSELEFLYCHTKNDQNILEGLARICRSIKKLFVGIENDDSGIIKLIEAQKNLKEVKFISIIDNISFHKSLEESLTKHANTIRYLKIGWTPITKFLSYLTNLLKFEIYFIDDFIKWNNLNYYENLSMPVLKILRLIRIPSDLLINLIKNTKETLTEISVFCDNSTIIQAIYQNCPNLRYLKLTIFANFITPIPEFENLLTNCQLLNGLVVETEDDDNNEFSWDELFIILSKSSPNSLFKFKFGFGTIKLKEIKLFFDNWKDKVPILLIVYIGFCYYQMEKKQQIEAIIKEYQEKGIIRKYSLGHQSSTYIHNDDFEWIYEGRSL
ncbi:hypothetical protein RclHR1_00610021 [Rhizophagus clarus]|uniref:F-box domain-containing protein n=1 Tax=Rhizophagus clarus TaxID=94130 RepID=A0A2Z6SHV0_9GLOM|nr:hypothetical protein RclHR1_00610021 [Rhizophagus clarus]GES75979.1 hypothetical protein GLOIN_2v1870945 [Rhizophagus clarus]